MLNDKNKILDNYKNSDDTMNDKTNERLSGDACYQNHIVMN